MCCVFGFLSAFGLKTFIRLSRIQHFLVTASATFRHAYHILALERNRDERDRQKDEKKEEKLEQGMTTINSETLHKIN